MLSSAAPPSDAEAEPAGDAGRQVIARAARLLRSLAAAPVGLTVADLTRSSGLPRTTVSRLVSALAAERLVVQAGREIRIGPGLARLAVAADPDPANLARPHMRALATRVRETIDLWVDLGDGVELIEELASEQEVRIVAARGFRLPLHTSAPGKLFLAAYSDEQVRRFAAGGLARLTPRTLVDPASLLAELHQIRRTGLSFDLEEHAVGVSAVAVAVDLLAPRRYALALAAPSARFNPCRAEFVSALQSCAAGLNRSGANCGTT